jgi:hypothetical protein
MVPPRLARTLMVSTLARSQSTGPAHPAGPRPQRCRASSTPAAVHSVRRRQQVDGDPQPSSRAGSSRQGVEVRHVHDRGKAGPIGDGPMAAAVRRAGGRRQQRLYQRPQLIRHKLLGQSRHSDASCQTSPRGAKQRLKVLRRLQYAEDSDVPANEIADLVKLSVVDVVQMLRRLAVQALVWEAGGAISVPFPARHHRFATVNHGYSQSSDLRPPYYKCPVARVVSGSWPTATPDG